jgi:hypothetical protein
LKHALDTIKLNITEIERRHSEALKSTKTASSRIEDDAHKLIDVVLLSFFIGRMSNILSLALCFQTCELMQAVKTKLISMKSDSDKVKKVIRSHSVVPGFLAPRL